MYQLLPPFADPVPPSTYKYWPILTQYHHIWTSTAPYWPSTIMYQPVPPSTDLVPPSINNYQPLPHSTDPVPSYINQYHSILTQYHQVSTNTNLYYCCLGITDFCTVYPGSCFTGSCIGRWDQASGFFCLEPVLRRQLTGSEPDRWSKANGIMPTLFVLQTFNRNVQGCSIDNHPSP